MNFGKRYQAAIEQCNLSAPIVARATGVQVSTINAVIRRDSKRTEFMPQLLAALNPAKVNIDWVRTGEGTIDPVIPSLRSSKEGLRPGAVSAATVRISRTAVAHAGDLIRVVTLDSETIEMPVSFIQSVAAGRTSGLCWSVQADNSMQSRLLSGDSYIIDTHQKNPETTGLYSIVLNGSECARYLSQAGEGFIEVKADSGESNLVASSDLTIIGRVIFRMGAI